jgi:hypothetical protein
MKPEQVFTRGDMRRALSAAIFALEAQEKHSTIPPPSTDQGSRSACNVCGRSWTNGVEDLPSTDQGAAVELLKQRLLDTIAAISRGEFREDCGHQIDQLITAALAQGRAPSWQSIETAPKDGTRVILGGFYRGKLLIDLSEYDEGDPVDEVPPHWPWRWHANAGCEQPTIWMPLPAPPPLVGGAEREQESDHGAGLIHQVASPKAETEPRPNSEELAFISELIEKKRASLRARIDSVNAWRDGDEAEHRAGHALAEKMAGRKLAYVDAAGREARAKLDEKIGNKHAHEIVLLENIARALNGSGNQPASAERAQATRRSAAQEKHSNILPSTDQGAAVELQQAKQRVWQWMRADSDFNIEMQHERQRQDLDALITAALAQGREKL